ncbi:hypothetical protein CIFRMM251M_26470 [Citrobacter freundii]|uniref:hypothetical protein n=1 Tax=Citrobacter freundii TaxID=546 RepID=UPI003B2461CE
MKNIFYIGILVLPSALANTNPLGVEPKLSSLDINDFELFSLKTGMTLEDFDAVIKKNTPNLTEKDITFEPAAVGNFNTRKLNDSYYEKYLIIKINTDDGNKRIEARFHPEIPKKKEDLIKHGKRYILNYISYNVSTSPADVNNIYKKIGERWGAPTFASGYSASWCDAKDIVYGDRCNKLNPKALMGIDSDFDTQRMSVTLIIDNDWPYRYKIQNAVQSFMLEIEKDEVLKKVNGFKEKTNHDDI